MIQKLRDFIVTKKVYLALVGISLLFLGRPSLYSWVSPFAAAFGYAALWLSISQETTFKRRLFLGWGYFFVFVLLATIWLISHPFLYIYFTWVFLAALFSFPFSLLSAFCLRKPLTPLSILGFSLAFSFLEYSFTLLPCGFPFLSSALYFSWSSSSLILASVLGEIGLSFLVFATNLFAYHSLKNKRFTPLIVLVLLPYIVGGMILLQKTHQKNKFDKKIAPLKVAVVHTTDLSETFFQPMPPEKLVTKSWTALFSLLEPLKPGDVDFILFPEGIIPYPAEAPLCCIESLPYYLPALPYTHLSAIEVSRLLAEHFNTSIMIGLEGRSYNEGKSHCHNSCYFISKEQTKRYDKQLLLPFGEYIPFEVFQNLLSSYGVHGSFVPGNDVVIFPGQITPFICYEEVFACYTQKTLPFHPKMFVSISSDSWFSSDMLGQEHFALARLRAVESGKPLIRSCNMGVSGAIDALGTVVLQSRGQPECLTTTISRFHYPPHLIGIALWEKIFFFFFSLFFLRYLYRHTKQRNNR